MTYSQLIVHLFFVTAQSKASYYLWMTKSALSCYPKGGECKWCMKSVHPDETSVCSRFGFRRVFLLVLKHRLHSPDFWSFLCLPFHVVGNNCNQETWKSCFDISRHFNKCTVINSWKRKFHIFKYVSKEQRDVRICQKEHTNTRHPTHRQHSKWGL